MHGLGNDFMVIDGVNQSLQLTPAQIIKLADRHRGIGFDQLLMVEPATMPNTDFFYRIYNQDGSEVAQCGNGARCLARFIADNKLSDKKQLRIATNNSQMELILEEDGNISVNMGIPQFVPKHIPLNVTREQLMYSIAGPNSDLQFAALSIGNPHAILFVNDLMQAPVDTLGAWFNTNFLFPEGVNVSFVHIRNRQQFDLRVYERGVGETQACGSGAAAAMIAARRDGKLDAHATAHLAGGDLLIRWQGENEPVWLRGPAETVFVGAIYIPD
jgi:diaminopimelate epimerase